MWAKQLSKKGPKYRKNKFSEDLPRRTDKTDLQCRNIDIMFRQAVEEGDVYRVRFLLKFAADKQIPLAVDYRPLHISVRRVVELLLYEERTGNNASMEIARAEEIVIALLATSADVNSVDFQGRTVLHFAALAHAQRIVRLLLKAGSSVNSVDNRGRSPLDIAIVTNRGEVVRLLLAELETRDKALK